MGLQGEGKEDFKGPAEPLQQMLPPDSNQVSVRWVGRWVPGTSCKMWVEMRVGKPWEGKAKAVQAHWEVSG